MLMNPSPSALPAWAANISAALTDISISIWIPPANPPRSQVLAQLPSSMVSTDARLRAAIRFASSEISVVRVRDFCGETQLCGEYLYYQIKDANGGTLHKIKCNKKDNTQVADELISPMCYDNGIIYYTGVSNDHDIHALHTKDGDITTPVISGFYFFPVVKDGYLYYLNGTSNYSLWRTNLTNGEQQLVTSDRCDCFTIDNNHIYYSYSNAMNPSLRRCDLDGGNKVVLFEGVVNSINVTSRYVYFKVFGDDNTYFHIPVDLSAPASTFTVISN